MFWAKQRVKLGKLLGSLRFKIVAYTLAAFTLVLTALSFFIFTTYENYLRRDFDNRLRDRAESMAESIEIAADTTMAAVPQISPFRFPGYYFQIRSAQGRLLEKSKTLGDSELPFKLQDDLEERARTGEFATIRDELAKHLVGKSELRMLTIYHEGQNTAPYFLQIAVSLDFIEQSVLELGRTLILAFALGVGVAGLTSFLVAWRTLAPLDSIARQARQLTAARLDQRISEPRADDEVAYLVRVINGMLDRLKQAFDAQEQFIADVSHELRTPLSILLGEAQVLSQQNRTKEDYHRFVTSVQEEMRALARVVQSLLTLSRAHAGFPLPAVSILSLNDVVVEAVQRCQPIARQREIRLVPALSMPESEESELLVEGDAELLCTMFSNLVRNAIRFSNPRSTVEIRSDSADSSACVIVSDRGPGLAPTHIESLFDRFYRAPANGTTGSGLGLAIAKAVVDLHRGQIRAQNRVGGGSEFIVTLPRASPELVGVS